MPSKKMNILWLQNVKPPASGQVDYFDEGERGLGLRIGKSGKKTWFVMYRAKGDQKKRRLTLDHYPAMTLSEAREKARSIKVEVDKGNDPAGEKQIEKGAPTFKELAAEYMERHARQKKKPKSIHEDQRIIDKDLVSRFGNRKAHEIKRRDIILLLDDIVDRGSGIMANRTLALVRKIFNWGIERDIVANNPCVQVKAPAKENRRDRIYSVEEIKALWEAFEDVPGSTSPLYKLLLVTAQRPQELMTMSWEDIDLDSSWWTIPGEYTKNKLPHRVPLTDMALKILQKVQQGCKDAKWVFPSRIHRCGHIANIQKASEKIKEESGVEDFTAYPLRHTTASFITGMGIPRLVVGKILNHVEPGVTAVYDRHSYDQEKRQALEKWSRKLEQILYGKKAKVIPIKK